jgi:uncharacterized protein (TIGR02145 family)
LGGNKMKTLGMIILVFSVSCHLSKAQDTLYIYKSGSILAKYAVTSFDSITFHKTVLPTNPGNKVTDIDGNIYHTVTIGTQVWMVENLKTTRYSNGNEIPDITEAAVWSNLTTGAYSNYNNNKNNSTTYGRLYNWFAVNDSCNVCPTGFHVPTNDDWTKLTTYLGGESVAGGKLKETGTNHWKSPNGGATNETGFAALPGGHRSNSGNFNDIGADGYWWSSTETGSNNAWNRDIDFNTSDMFRDDAGKNRGFSVRCLQD